MTKQTSDKIEYENNDGFKNYTCLIAWPCNKTFSAGGKKKQQQKNYTHTHKSLIK